MRFARALLFLGALLLVATAIFHSTGVDMVANWVSEGRRPLMRMLWFSPAIDWVIVAAIWAIIGWRGEGRFSWLVWLTALIPLSVAAMLAMAIGAGFPGFWMLVGAVALAATGAARLRPAV